MSRITTHILDTTKGKPAQGVGVVLYQQSKEEWTEIARGTTDKDGRIAELLNKELLPERGIYKMRFETQEYFDRQEIKTFYPFAEISFHITANEHYHIPLLLNPFGYSTYRGS